MYSATFRTHMYSISFMAYFKLSFKTIQFDSAYSPSPEKQQVCFGNVLNTFIHSMAQSEFNPPNCSSQNLK